MIETSLLIAPAIPIATAAVSAVGGLIGALSARRAERRAQRQQRNERQEMRRLERAYANIDTSNPYLNMENTMEDLTINQQQAQFQSQQFAHSQANIMGELRGAAGGSGIAALAQSLAQQGQIASQQSSASIGQQEAANQRAAAAQASQIQSMERQGEILSRNMEREKQATLLGMSQQELAGAQQRIAAAEQAKMAAISGGIQGAASMVAGFGDQTDYKSLYEDLKGDE